MKRYKTHPYIKKGGKYSFPSLFDDFIGVKGNGGPAEKKGNS